jgi:hypothetical protein
MLKRRAPDLKPFRRGVYRSMGSRWRDLTLSAGAGATTVVMESSPQCLGLASLVKTRDFAPSIDITRQEHRTLDRGWYLAHAAAAAT